jgi:site-specific recombinase XerD
MSRRYELSAFRFSASMAASYTSTIPEVGALISPVLPEDATWSSVTLDVMQAYVKQLAEQNYSASTIARKVAALKTFFHWLMQRGLIVEDPAPQLRAPKVEKHVPRLLSQEEVDRLLDAVSKNGARNAQRALCHGDAPADDPANRTGCSCLARLS